MTETGSTGGRRTALVTGAGSGIGRATALRLAEDSYDLVLVDRNLEAVEATAERAGTGVRTVVADLSEPAAATAQIAAVLGSQTPDLLVNCAGVGWAADTSETTDEIWETTLAVNLSAAFHLCQLVLPGMLARRRGVIVSVASAGALVGLRRRVAYCASKAGLLGMTRAIAADHAGDGIRINAVCPGTVDTPWIGRMLEGEADPESVRQRMEQRQLDGRMGTPDEVADWISFISSDRGRFMNGAALVIDGGLTAV
jgi:NAD(P)-dependent dehydrogenase (short-subunit alcohol dehydrogenase family)